MNDEPRDCCGRNSCNDVSSQQVVIETNKIVVVQFLSSYFYLTWTFDDDDDDDDDDSATRWLDYFLCIWPFTPMKICPIALYVAKVDLRFCQILKMIKNFPKTI